MKYIDIRNEFDYKIRHIEGAININYSILKLSPERYLNKNEKYILYCDKGIKSNELSIYLNKLGYNTTSLYGGINNYKLK